VDETQPATPQSQRSERRLIAEKNWQALATATDVPLQIFRLAGIYGPGRSAIERVQSGQARCIIKPGQVFNRIHVTDAAIAIAAAMQGRGTHTIYNLTDDMPAPPEDVITYAASCLGADPPPRVPISEAGLSEMAQSFYCENKRVRNDRIKDDLGVQLTYPSYREGLTAIAKEA
nr:NAD(P)-dependent oxidoreductase [Alphaproteobacteria bacterium]